MSDLKPCPFCGSPGELSSLTPDGYRYARCSSCDITSETSRSVEALKATWNTRVSPWRSLRDDPPAMGSHILMRDELAVGFSTLRVSMPEMIELTVNHTKYTDWMEIPD